VGRYCSAEVTGPETILITIPEPTRRRAYGMRGDYVSAPLHHHFAVQCRLMSGTWAHLLAPGYAERAVWTRSAAPDGLPLTGEDKQGMEPSVRIQKVGAGAQVTHSGPGAAPSQEAGAGAAGHVAASELPRAGRREPEPRGHVAALELPPAGRREPELLS
jgi:hypothetical protein